MTEIGIATLLLIISNIFCSVQGLNDRPSFDRFNVNVDSILFGKEYRRLITSGFFHVNWLQLAINIASICFFTEGLELHLGGAKYLLVYFAGLLGGNLFALIVHRHHPTYTAVGATGAITGIIFATIVLFPAFQIGFMGIHFSIPAWFYGFLFVLFSIYGIKSTKHNIGHEAHLAGGLAGLMMALLLDPTSLTKNYLTIIAIAIPTLFFIFIIITRPMFILIDNQFYYQQIRSSRLERFQLSEKIDQEQEIDLILEKIHRNGIKSLTKVEKEKLDFYSKIIQ